MAMPLNFIVVRHGQSIGNLAKRHSETGDHSLADRLKGTHTAHWPLTKLGIEQAQATGRFINSKIERGEFQFGRMYVSAFARALQTAAHLNLLLPEWQIDQRITERDWGIFDRMNEEEREERHAEDLRMREVEPFFWAPPQGEHFQHLIIRIRDFIDSVYRANVQGSVVVVCHGEVAQAFRVILCQMTPEEYAEMEFSKDPAKRIHNCQIDHYTRLNPLTGKTHHRLEWFRFYRPSEGDDTGSVWQHIPSRTFSSEEILAMGNRLAKGFSGFF